MKPPALEKNIVARKIVANLLIRERSAKRLLNKALKADNDMLKNCLTAEWAEAHNAAVSSRNILHGRPH